MRTLLLPELAARTGESPEWLARLCEFGVLDASRRFVEADVEMARLVRALVQQGISLAEIAEAQRSGILQRCVMPLLALRLEDGRLPEVTLVEAERQTRLPTNLVRRLWEVMSAGEPAELLSRDDIEMLRIARRALDLGFPQEALLQLCRVYADALGRTAEASVRLFHLYVHDQIPRRGTDAAERFEASQAVARRLEPLVEPVLRYFQRKGQVRAEREVAVMHLSEELGTLREASVSGEVATAILFVDLASFTPLAEAMGDLKAAAVLERFGDIVRSAVRGWGGRIVKQIGDAFMLAFSEPRSGVGCALDIEHRISAQPRFPAARSGIHWGSALYREGDYVGSTVNVAARVAAAATRHQVLLTESVVTEVGSLPEIEIRSLGKHRLKGVAESIELFAAQHLETRGNTRVLDPVCGMEMEPDDVVVRLSQDQREHAFCSQGCLRRFVMRPDHYLEPHAD